MRIVYDQKHRQWVFWPHPLDPTDPDDFILVRRTGDGWVVYERVRMLMVDRRSAFERARKLALIIQRRNETHIRTGSNYDFAQRMMALSPAHKVRKALKTPRLRGQWRRFQNPMPCQVIDRDDRDDVQHWLDERGVILYLNVPFAYRKSKGWPTFVFCEVADFPDPQMAFEFRMRWL